jgi:hypothetical protein
MIRLADPSGPAASTAKPDNPATNPGTPTTRAVISGKDIIRLAAV